MSETLRDVAIDLARRLARCEANSAFSGFDAWEHSGEYFAGYMERINAADQERTCELDLDVSMERVKCSACGKAISYGANLLEVKYCPNCGARVVSDDE